LSKKISCKVLVFLLSVALGSVVLAQRQTGAIIGTVVDRTGAVLPGVIVTLTPSESVAMAPQVFVSTERGTFRFPSLLPGAYIIKVELEGFQTKELTGIVVSVGKTNTISIEMEIETIREAITVLGETPVVDIETAKTAVTFTGELLQNLPMYRDFYPVIESIPGSVSEEVAYRRTTSTHGSTVRGNQYSFDGVNVTDPTVNYPITNLSFDVMQEVEVETGGHPAEVGHSDGAYVNIVTKSGGNIFHGQAWFDYQSKGMVGRNLSDEQYDYFGLDRPTANRWSTDISANMGGPIIRDKAWFFGSFRAYNFERLIEGFGYTAGGFAMGGGPRDLEQVIPTHDELWAMGKVTWQATNKHRFTGMYHLNKVKEPWWISEASRWVSAEAVRQWDEKGHTANIQWNYIINPNFFLDTRFGYVYRDFGMPLRPEVWEDPDRATYYDYVYGYQTGSSRFEDLNWRRRTQLNAALSYFREDLLGGDHDFNFGWEYMNGWFRWECDKPAPAWYYFWAGSPYLPELEAFGKASYVDALAHHLDFREGNWTTSFYAQDSWTLGQRLTLNLGVRADYERANRLEATSGIGNTNPFIPLNPEYFSEFNYDTVPGIIKWFNVAPRLGFIYDLTGDAKTAIKGSYCRYYEYLMIQYSMATNPAYHPTIYYIWVDTDEDGVRDIVGDQWIEYGRWAGPGSEGAETDPDLKQPYVDELIIAVERELIPDLNVSLRYLYKRERNIVEDMETTRYGLYTPYMATDPGYDGVFGTSDDSSLTVNQIVGDMPMETWVFSNPPDGFRNFQAVEIIANKRMSHRWQMLGSLLWSRATGNIDLTYGASWGYSGAFDNPNYFVNRPDDSLLSMDRTWQAKLQGTYMAPYEINLSWYFTYLSGAPWERTLRVYLPSYPYSTTVLAEKPGTRREPSISRLDIRLEKEFELPMGRLGVFFDCFNVLNTAVLDYWTGRHGDVRVDGSFSPHYYWGRVTGVNTPRVFKLSVRYTF